MPHILKNKSVEIFIDLPNENYKLSRFDWTGKIVGLKFKDKWVSGHKIVGGDNEQFYGKGFYNEFGIDSPLGYNDSQVGGWFHKIGIGLLKKDEAHYDFKKSYELNPSEFDINAHSEKLQLRCKSEFYMGYSYLLEKEIELMESGFVVKYYLENTGEKPISTNEYNHNFLSIDKKLIGTDYLLKFPFQIKPGLTGSIVNPENVVTTGQNKIKFKGTPKEQFFFSDLSGGEKVDAKWELINVKSKIRISETGNFKTNQVNLWGWGHVISPELFFKIDINAGQSIKWSRTYNLDCE